VVASWREVIFSPLGISVLSAHIILAMRRAHLQVDGIEKVGQCTNERYLVKSKSKELSKVYDKSSVVPLKGRFALQSTWLYI